MSTALAGHRSLIVGGSSGIGLAAAKLLLSEGATVTITGRHVEKLTAAATTLKSVAEAGGGFRPVLGYADDAFPDMKDIVAAMLGDDVFAAIDRGEAV